ncbi:DNA-directed RNA polymerase subunit D [uncultured archaeon]|nr:DNA-directed RNA polymerase subunit D [uncultured archaeon]
MEVTNLKKKGDVITFTVKGADAAVINALRRIVISEVPVMAIEEVTFHDNTSALNDEMLAHRLGLTPLKTDLKNYALPGQKTKGKGKALEKAQFTLDITGPGIVHASDLNPQDPEITPVYPTTLINKLNADQHIKLEATARLGTGREHIKWQAGLMSYEQKQDGRIDAFVESFGQLPVEELLLEAFKVLNEKMEVFSEKIA